MKINVFFQTCKACGEDTREIKIWDAPDPEHLEQRTFSRYGLRCLRCAVVQSHVRYRYALENPCCDDGGSSIDLGLKYGDGLVPHYARDTGELTWILGIDGTGIDGIVFCPFCGTKLPTKPNTIPDHA